DPDSSPLLKLPDNGPPHLLLVGGIDHQAVPLLRREGGWAGVPAPRSAAGEQHPRSQPQRQPAYLFHIFHSSAGSSSSVLPNYSTFSFLFSLCLTKKAENNKKAQICPLLFCRKARYNKFTSGPPVRRLYFMQNTEGGNIMKRALALLLSASLTLSLAACGGGGGGTSQAGGSSGPASSGGTGELTATQQIIQEAQGMTLEELAQKAIEESNGQKFYSVGNSSRVVTAIHLFVT